MSSWVKLSHGIFLQVGKGAGRDNQQGHNHISCQRSQSGTLSFVSLPSKWYFYSIKIKLGFNIKITVK